MAKTRESIMAEQIDNDNNALNSYAEQKTGNGNNDGKVNGNGNAGYSEQNIQILEGLEAVRVRPGM
jgi:DNA gyrase subunit B